MTKRYVGPRIVRRCVTCGWISNPAKTPAIGAAALRRHSCAKHVAKQERALRAAERDASIDRTPRPCTHKRARHVHGTRVCYVLDRCRCRPCADAVNAYESDRRRQKAYGRWDNYVDAGPVRAHVEALRAAGMGWRRIARVSGVSGGALSKLIYGKQRPDGSYVPSVRVTKRTAERILAVREPVLAGGAVTCSVGTTRRLQALVACGWSASRLGARLGIDPTNMPPLMHGTRDVTEATRRAVAELYDELWDQAPPTSSRFERGSVSRAKRFAAERGWAPPLAWDEGTIDDVGARPDRGARVSVSRAEQIRELLELGESVESAARRLGVTVGAINRALLRAEEAA